MALRDTLAFDEWIEREAPSDHARRVARDFLSEAGDAPWRSPSFPIPDLSEQPFAEVRAANLMVSGEDSVRIWYRHTYATRDIDLIAVTST